MEQTIYFYQGEGFAHALAGKFAKDVLVDGEWHDQKTGRTVPITPARRRLLMEESNRYLANGNEIPFQDGHNTDATKTLGAWPGPFAVVGDRLFAVAEPKGDDVVGMVKAGKINRVSVVIRKEWTDPKGNFYPEVITSIDATPVPVVTGQRDFVALSREAGIPTFELAQVVAPTLREPTFDELAQEFAPEAHVSFETLAQGFKVEEPSFAELAQAFADAPRPATPKPPAPEPEKFSQAPAAPPAAPPINVNVTIAEGAFKTENHPPAVTVNQGDVHLAAALEIKPAEKKTVTVKGPDGKESTATITQGGK